MMKSAMVSSVFGPMPDRHTHALFAAESHSFPSAAPKPRRQEPSPVRFSAQRGAECRIFRSRARMLGLGDWLAESPRSSEKPDGSRSRRHSRAGEQKGFHLGSP